MPVLTSCSDISRRHCAGMLYFSRSLGRTPSHLMSGVVRLIASYDIFLEAHVDGEDLEAVRVGLEKAEDGDVEGGAHLVEEEARRRRPPCPR